MANPGATTTLPILRAAALADILQHEREAVGVGDVALAMVLHEAVGRLLGTTGGADAAGEVTDLATARAKRERGE